MKKMYSTQLPKENNEYSGLSIRTKRIFQFPYSLISGSQPEKNNARGNVTVLFSHLFASNVLVFPFKQQLQQQRQQNEVISEAIALVCPLLARSDADYVGQRVPVPNRQDKLNICKYLLPLTLHNGVNLLVLPGSSNSPLKFLLMRHKRKIVFSF